MRIEVRFINDVGTVSLSGKFLAGGDGPYLHQKVKDMIDAGAKKLIIDFSEVPYIDSTGLGFLARSRITAQKAGVNLILAGVNQHVKRILDGVRLTSFFTIAKDETTARAKFEDVAQSTGQSDTRPVKGPKKKRSPKSIKEKVS